MCIIFRCLSYIYKYKYAYNIYIYDIDIDIYNLKKIINIPISLKNIIIYTKDKYFQKYIFIPEYVIVQ